MKKLPFLKFKDVDSLKIPKIKIIFVDINSCFSEMQEEIANISNLTEEEKKGFVELYLKNDNNKSDINLMGKWLDSKLSDLNKEGYHKYKFFCSIESEHDWIKTFPDSIQEVMAGTAEAHYLHIDHENRKLYSATNLTHFISSCRTAVELNTYVKLNKIDTSKCKDDILYRLCLFLDIHNLVEGFYYQSPKENIACAIEDGLEITALTSTSNSKCLSDAGINAISILS